VTVSQVLPDMRLCRRRKAIRASLENYPEMTSGIERLAQSNRFENAQSEFMTEYMT